MSGATEATPGTEAAATPPTTDVGAANPPAQPNATETPAPAPEPKPADTTPPDPAAVVPAKADDYTFTPPNDESGQPLPVDQDALTAFKAEAHKMGLTQAQLDGVMGFGAHRLKALADAPYKAWEATQAQWKSEIEKDPEIGGDKLPTAKAEMARAIDRFGGDDLRKALDFTGAGNNPAVVKALAQIGRAIGEDAKFITGKAAAAPKKSDAEILYGSTKE